MDHLLQLLEDNPFSADEVSVALRAIVDALDHGGLVFLSIAGAEAINSKYELNQRLPLCFDDGPAPSPGGAAD